VIVPKTVTLAPYLYTL